MRTKRGNSKKGREFEWKNKRQKSVKNGEANVKKLNLQNKVKKVKWVILPVGSRELLWSSGLCASPGQRLSAVCSVQLRMDAFDLPCREPLGHTACIFQLHPTSRSVFFFPVPCLLKASQLVSSLSLSECAAARPRVTDCFFPAASYIPHSHGSLPASVFALGRISGFWKMRLSKRVSVRVLAFHMNIKYSQDSGLAFPKVLCYPTHSQNAWGFRHHRDRHFPPLSIYQRPLFFLSPGAQNKGTQNTKKKRLAIKYIMI